MDKFPERRQQQRSQPQQQPQQHYQSLLNKLKAQTCQREVRQAMINAQATRQSDDV